MIGSTDIPELRACHAEGLDFERYLQTDPDRAGPWREIHERTGLSSAQRSLVAGFVRRMPVLVVSGIWCGDCVQQGPLLERIAEASELIDLRWLDRDEHSTLARHLRINGLHPACRPRSSAS